MESGRGPCIPVAAGSAASGGMDAKEGAAASEAGMDARRA